VALGQDRQDIEVGHEFGVDFHFLQRGVPVARGIGRTECANQVLDTGVDVSTIKGEDAGFARRREIGHSRLPLDCAMSTRQLPAATDDAGYAVTGPQLEDLQRLQDQAFFVSGTAVVSAWLKPRVAIREIRSLLGQLGSGQATSASVDIQSLAWVARCFAASKGRTEASE
jgi:hypothetical protein